MADIEKTFIYEIADTYLAQTNNEGKTATWTYTGPNKIWLEIVSETGKLDNTGYFVEEEGAPDIPTDPHLELVCVDCAVDPLVCSLVGADTPKDYSTLPQYSEELPNGNTYERPDPQSPDHTYDVNSGHYNKETLEWTFDWFKPWTTLEKKLKERDVFLEIVDQELRIGTDMPESRRTALTEYRKSLEDLEITWEDYLTPERVHMIEFPEHPFNG
jgi:hypothetical protein